MSLTQGRSKALHSQMLVGIRNAIKLRLASCWYSGRYLQLLVTHTGELSISLRGPFVETCLALDLGFHVSWKLLIVGMQFVHAYQM